MPERGQMMTAEERRTRPFRSQLAELRRFVRIDYGGVVPKADLPAYFAEELEGRTPLEGGQILLKHLDRAQRGIAQRQTATSRGLLEREERLVDEVNEAEGLEGGDSPAAQAMRAAVMRNRYGANWQEGSG